MQCLSGARYPLDVATYMNLCLGHPEHGYYMKQDPFGAGGDFTTAPEISQMFGEVIGAWAADTWMKLGAPESFVLLECGPGRGTLMADILRATKGVENFTAAAQVHFLETSPVLRALQKKKCPDAAWHDTLETLPHDAPVIAVANEFFDALPVHQLVRTAAGWDERVIENVKGELRWSTGKASRKLVDMVSAGMTEKEGAIVEVSPARSDFMHDLCARISTQNGAALIFDYGYDAPGTGDTLQALHRHEYTDVLAGPGDADLTAHVDFAALRVAAGDLKVFGPAGQSEVLKALGIELRAQALSRNADEKQQSAIRAALRRLTDEAEMGTLFRVMGVSRDVDLAGF